MMVSYHLVSRGASEESYKLVHRWYIYDISSQYVWWSNLCIVKYS